MLVHRLLIAAVAVAATVGTLVAPSDAVFPYDPDVTVRERLAGADRFGTAVAVSKSGFPNGAPVVYLASGTNFPDALAAGPIAAHDGGPLLLTRPDALPGAIAAEIARLDPARIVIVGGTGAVTAGVQKSIAKLVPTATVSRVAGKDRYETARALIRTAFPSTIPSLYISTGKVFADALSAGAAAATTGGAVLLVDGTTAVLPTATTALLDTLQPAGVTVVGGAGAVSVGIFATVSARFPSTARAGGADRYETSALIASAWDSADHAYVATGSDFPDALAGSALAGTRGEPLFVLYDNCQDDAVTAAEKSLGIAEVTILGGSGALTDYAPIQACPTGEVPPIIQPEPIP